jgi:hypothetical protein
LDPRTIIAIRVLPSIAGVVAIFNQIRPISIISWSKLKIFTWSGGFFAVNQSASVFAPLIHGVVLW